MKKPEILDQDNIIHNGKKLKTLDVTKQRKERTVTVCPMCYFYHGSFEICLMIPCEKHERTDGKCVVFIKDTKDV